MLFNLLYLQKCSLHWICCQSQKDPHEDNLLSNIFEKKNIKQAKLHYGFAFTRANKAEKLRKQVRYFKHYQVQLCQKIYK